MNVALHPPDILSICTGGGGLDLGVELAIPGARSVCMVEREAFAAGRLVSAMEAGLLAPAPVWSDARTFNGRRWRGCVDGLIGGIPCQPHSLAGKRGGAGDLRDLWSDARRIIVQSRVWFVLIENVRGMLSAKPGLDPGALRVWRDLQRLGFRVEGGLFTAAEVGASHERERFFLLGVADPDRERLQGLRPDPDALGRQDAGRPAGLCGRTDLVDPARVGRGEGRAEPELRRGRHSPAGAGGELLVHAECAERRAGAGAGHERDRPDAGRAEAAGGAGKSGQPVDDATLARGRAVSVQPGRQDEAGGDADRPSRFPPFPDDARAWAAIHEHAPLLLPALSRHDRFGIAIRAARAAADGDPAARERLDPDSPYGLSAAVVQAIAQSTLRRMADGVAARVDELRMLGNGVVSLEAGYALSTLAARLAAAGSPGAARLVRMMGERG